MPRYSQVSLYGMERDTPCTGCTHFLDSFDGVARHAVHRTNIFIVAKSPLARLLAIARKRGWRHLTFLSTAGNTYDRDYFGDSLALSAYFSLSWTLFQRDRGRRFRGTWTAFQADRGRCFSLIVDDSRGARVILNVGMLTDFSESHANQQDRDAPDTTNPSSSP